MSVPSQASSQENVGILRQGIPGNASTAALGVHLAHFAVTVFGGVNECKFCIRNDDNNKRGVVGGKAVQEAKLVQEKSSVGVRG